MTWYTLFERTGLVDNEGLHGNTIRIAIPTSVYNTGAPVTGTQVRLTFQAGTAGGLTLNNLYLGHGVAGGSGVDFDGTQVLVTASGSVTVNTSFTFPVIYAFDKTKPLVLSADVVFPGYFASLADSDIKYSWLATGSSGSTTVTIGGTANKVLLPKVEIFLADPPGNPTCTIDKFVGQQDPTSASTIKFKVQFNKGVTGFTSSDCNLSASTVTWIGGSPTVLVTGSDLAYDITISGMLTIGNVVVTIPASVVTAVADGLPNDAAVPIDNSVAWDPDLIDPHAPNVTEITIVNRNMLRIEVKDPPVILGHYQELATPDTGAGTYPITNVVNNGHGQIRITTPYGTSIPNWYIQNMVASPVSNGSGGFLIRCTMFDTSLLGAGPVINGVLIIHARGTVEGNSGLSYFGPFCSIQIIDSTHFDILGSTFVNAYLGGGMIQYNSAGFTGESSRVAIHSVGGTTEANGGWVVYRSSPTTLDLLDSHFTNTYTSGGRVMWPYHYHQRPNPTKGGALDYCMLNDRTGKSIRFQDEGRTLEEMFNREASAIAANYSISGGFTITNVFRKSTPYSSGWNAKASVSYSQPIVPFRHYLYLQLSGNLTNGTYTLLFPSGTGLPPKTFTYNDKTTRCCALHTHHPGHRASDPGKFAYLGEWVPELGVHGEMSFSAVTAWHLINDAGTVVATFGAPAQRSTPTSVEGASLGQAQTPWVIRDGPPMKVTAATKASPRCTVTVVDASAANNGDLIAFADMSHWAAGRPATHADGSHVGMWELEYDTAGINFCAFRIVNKSGNTFQVDSPRAVLTTPTVSSGGSGYSVGSVITLANGVTLRVATLSGSAVATVTIVSNEERDGWNAPYKVATGKIDYPFTTPSNPQAQVSAVGGGTGASFNLTWGVNFDDRTLLPGGFSFGNPDTTAAHAFDVTTSATWKGVTYSDRGNLCYHVNAQGNRANTYVYGLDYASFVTEGTYRIWLPNIGVSDPIVIAENRWWRVAKNYLIGCYHERSGIAFDGRFGFTRALALKNRPEQPIYKSYMPYALTNYTLEQNPGGYIYDCFLGIGQGGAYDPWITTTTSTAFGSHQDAGDWDCRLNETCWGYYQILESWERVLPAARAAFYNMGTPTCLEAGMDPTVFAGTNGLPSPIVEVIWGIEPQRSSQESYGGVTGGINYGEGVEQHDISGTTTYQIYTWYPDQMVTFDYVLVAAKLARILNSLGYTALASTYQTSAVAAYNWAALMQTDTTARDAHYLPVKTRQRWTTAEYNSAMTTFVAATQSHHANAAAALYYLTGSSTYKTVCDANYPATAADVRISTGNWEYANAPGATPTTRATIRDIYTTKALNAFLPTAEATDISYYNGFQLGVWLMENGGANDWGLNTPILTYAATVFDTVGDPHYDPANATRCRKALQMIATHRHGGNALGWAQPRGIGHRHTTEHTHLDSRGTGQPCPTGIPSWTWGGYFPGLASHLGDGFNNRIQHQQYDPWIDNFLADETFVKRELYPNDQLCWPRLEYVQEFHIAIAHMEFTTQQQLLPGLATAMYLQGYDGNNAIELESGGTAQYIVKHPRIHLR